MKTSKIIKITVLIPVVAVTLFLLPGLFYMGVTLIYGNEDRMFEPQWTVGFQEADKILAAHGLCTTKYACSADAVSIYVSGYAVRLPKGFKIEIYGTSDQKLLNELSQAFIGEFDNTPNMERLTIHAYAPTRHQVGNHLLPMRGSILDIDMKRTANNK